MAKRKPWVEEIANALQVAALLAGRLRRQLGTDAHDAIDLEAALDRAVRALRRPTKREGRK